jgi:hypothetical protein
MPRTALGAGASPSTGFAHYRTLATEAEGKAWFAIEPEHRKGANLMHLPQAAQGLKGPLRS